MTSIISRLALLVSEEKPLDDDGKPMTVTQIEDELRAEIGRLALAQIYIDARRPEAAKWFTSKQVGVK